MDLEPIKNRPILATDFSECAVQDNTLINACYSMTLNEQRLLMLAIRNISPKQWLGVGHQVVATVTAKEWEELYGTNPYLMLKRAATEMLGRHVTYRTSVESKKLVTKVNWLSSVTYHEGEGFVTLRFTPEITIRLTSLMAEYTPVRLEETRDLTSAYSIRLLQNFSQYRSTGVWRVSIEDLRFILDCVHTYPNVYPFKVRVLNPALDELRNKLGMKIDVTDVKKGRNIVQFVFKFKWKKGEWRF